MGDVIKELLIAKKMLNWVGCCQHILKST